MPERHRQRLGAGEFLPRLMITAPVAQVQTRQAKQRRPVFSAAMMVLPEPAKGSKNNAANLAAVLKSPDDQLHGLHGGVKLALLGAVDRPQVRTASGPPAGTDRAPDRSSRTRSARTACGNPSGRARVSFAQIDGQAQVEPGGPQARVNNGPLLRRTWPCKGPSPAFKPAGSPGRRPQRNPETHRPGCRSRISRAFQLG